MCKKNASYWFPILSVLLGLLMFVLEQDAKRKFEILQERKVALFDALHVADLVYANMCFNNKKPLNPKEWDIYLARSAINKMLIYCKDPQKTVSTFYKVLGVYNPDIETPNNIRVADLDEFRKQVAYELDTSEFIASNSTYTWIYSLPGTLEAKKFEMLRKSDGRKK